MTVRKAADQLERRPESLPGLYNVIRERFTNVGDCNVGYANLLLNWL